MVYNVVEPYQQENKTPKMIPDLIQNTRGSFGSLFRFQARRSTSLKSMPRQSLKASGNLHLRGVSGSWERLYSHSLSALKNKTEFKRQLESHATAIETLFGKKPAIFANDELIYSVKPHYFKSDIEKYTFGLACD